MYEGTSIGQSDLRQVQDHPPRRRRARDLPESEAQAATGVANENCRLQIADCRLQIEECADCESADC
jgi:hypothetical protein